MWGSWRENYRGRVITGWMMGNDFVTLNYRIPPTFVGNDQNASTDVTIVTKELTDTLQ